MDKEYVIVRIREKNYLLSSPRTIPQDVKNEMIDLCMSFEQMIEEGELDQIERDAIKQIPNFSDALFFIFLRKLIWKSGGWDFTPIPISITCNPTAYMEA